MNGNTENATVCYCFRKSVKDLKDDYRRCGSIARLQEETRVGTACGGCQVVLQSLFGEVPKNINNLDQQPSFGTTCSKPGSRVMKGFIVADGEIESTVYSSNAVAPQFGACDSSTDIIYALLDHRGVPVVHNQATLKTNETFVFETAGLDLPRPFFGTFLLAIARKNFGASRFNVQWTTKNSTTSTHENSATGRPRMFLPIVVDKHFLSGPNDIHLGITNPHSDAIPLKLAVFDIDDKRDRIVWETTLVPDGSMWLNANDYIFKPVIEKLPEARLALRIESDLQNIHRAQSVYFFLHNKQADIWSANHL